MIKQQQSTTMERGVSFVLQVGIIVSSLTILAGIILFFTHDPQPMSSYHQFATPRYTFPHGISTLKRSLQSGEGTGFIELGILLLIFTPVVRVAISILIFMRQRNTSMTFVTFFVLLMLICGFILGMTTR